MRAFRSPCALLLAACGITEPRAPMPSPPIPDLALAISPLTWQVTSLALPPGHISGSANAISNDGRIAGSVSTGFGNLSAAKWENGVPTLAAVFPGSISSSGQDINIHGTMVGYAAGASMVWPIRWTTSGPQQLMTGVAVGYALSINDAGVVAGKVIQASGYFAPVRWAANGTLSLLPLPPGYASGEAVSINNTGEIVGRVTETAGNTSRAYKWPASGAGVFLGPPGTRSSGNNAAGTAVGSTLVAAVRFDAATSTTLAPNANATAIGDNGRVAIYSGAVTGPYTWRDGSLVALPMIAGGTYGRPLSVNSCGSHVGTMLLNGASAPVMWFRIVCS
jgi:uncharacterized membrane protein